MKCPRCLRDIDDRASFCGFCGAVIMAPPNAQGAGPVPAEGMKPGKKAKKDRREAKKNRGEVPPKEAAPKKKKRTGAVVLLVLSVLAVVSGGALGFLFTKGIIDWHRLLPGRAFVWTDLAESIAAQLVSTDFEGEPGDGLETVEPDKTRDPEETAEPDETGDPEPSESQPDGDDPDADDPGGDDPDADDPGGDGPDADDPDGDDPGESESPGPAEGGGGSHYLKRAEDTLLIVDDRARALSEDSILEIMEEAQQLSGLSGYSIMIVLADGSFGMSVDEFAREYYNSALQSNQEEDDPFSTDGFIVLADVAGGEFHLSAFGAAGNRLTDDRISVILENLGPYTESYDLKTAVLDILERIPY